MITSERCEVCRYWRYSETSLDSECRKYAPRPQVREVGKGEPIYVQWVLTRRQDWCGEFDRERLEE